MIYLFIILILGVIIEIKFSPRFIREPTIDKNIYYLKYSIKSKTDNYYFKYYIKILEIRK